MRRLHFILVCFFALTGFANERVIYIGDSHSAGKFGAVIDEWLRSNAEVKFDFIASGGSAPLQWTNGLFVSGCGYVDSSKNVKQPVRKCQAAFHTPTLASILDQANSQPEEFTRKTVIIALGTNFSQKTADFDWQVRSVSNLIQMATHREYSCVWISPPNMRRFDSAQVENDVRIIQTGISKAKVSPQDAEPCLMIDSRLYSHYPTASDPAHESPDGIHYDFPASWWHFPEGVRAAEDWANGVIKELHF